jgi:AmmeMemoRadiSam system protein A
MLDERAIGYFRSPDAAGFRAFLKETSATICGRNGLGVLLELLPRIADDATPIVLSHYASVDLEGYEDDNSVTYISMAYVPGAVEAGEPMGPPPVPESCGPEDDLVDDALGRGLVRVARAALRTELTGTDDLARALRRLPTSPRLERLQGVFVTLNRADPGEIEKHGKLRGCIGQIRPVHPLPKAVVVAALQAALEDRRFQPVRPEELPGLAVEVSVLSAARAVESWEEIRIGHHGIILAKDGRRAVYLPHVATEQGWDLPETLEHLARKAGLPVDAWREGAEFQVFEAQVFHERSPEPGEKHGRG